MYQLVGNEKVKLRRFCVTDVNKTGLTSEGNIILFVFSEAV